MTGRIPHPLAPTDVERWFDGPASNDDVTEIVFAIERVSDSAVLGAIGLILPRGVPSAEMGYWLGRRFWNQGYTTEAVRLMLGTPSAISRSTGRGPVPSPKMGPRSACRRKRVCVVLAARCTRRRRGAATARSSATS